MDTQNFDDELKALGLLIGDHEMADLFYDEYTRMLKAIRADAESGEDGGLFPIRIFRLKSLLIAQALWLKTEYSNSLYEMAGGNVQ